MVKEPSMYDIDDFRGDESKLKRQIVSLVVASLLIVGAIYGGLKIYYDNHMPEIFNPIVKIEK